MSQENEYDLQSAMRKFIKIKLRTLLHKLDNDEIAIDAILIKLTEVQNTVNSAIELEKQLEEFNALLKRNLSEEELKKVIASFGKLQKQLNKVNVLLLKDLAEIDSYLHKKEAEKIEIRT